MSKVKKLVGAKVSSKNQVTLPVQVLREAGIEVGDRLAARCGEPGQIILERQRDVVSDLAGALPGMYSHDELAKLRDEWD